MKIAALLKQQAHYYDFHERNIQQWICRQQTLLSAGNAVSVVIANNGRARRLRFRLGDPASFIFYVPCELNRSQTFHRRHSLELETQVKRDWALFTGARKVHSKSSHFGTCYIPLISSLTCGPGSKCRAPPVYSCYPLSQYSASICLANFSIVRPLTMLPFGLRTKELGPTIATHEGRIFLSLRNKLLASSISDQISRRKDA